MPTKLRMVGSLVQARRSAATVNSGDTPGCKNAPILVAAVIESMDGRLAGSNASGPVAAVSTHVVSRPADSGGRAVVASPFSRSQRRKLLSSSLTLGLSLCDKQEAFAPRG